MPSVVAPTGSSPAHSLTYRSLMSSTGPLGTARRYGQPITAARPRKRRQVGYPCRHALHRTRFDPGDLAQLAVHRAQAGTAVEAAHKDVHRENVLQPGDDVTG